MSAQAVKDLHLAPTHDPSFGPELAGAKARWSGDGKAETEPLQGGLHSGRPPAQADRDNLEPHWVAAIDAATD